MEVKSVGTFPVISEKGHNIAKGRGWEWGDDGMSPDPIKKLSLGAESYVTITWKGFFTQSQVLHCRCPLRESRL